MSHASGLPTVTSGFGAYAGEAAFREAEGSFVASPAALDALLARRRVRFVIAGGMSAPLLNALPDLQPFARRAGERAVLDLEYMRAVGTGPLVIGGSGIPGAGVRHLEHLMPVGATLEQPPGLGFSLPALWVYERVAGARLAGTAPAGARVLATIDFAEQSRAHVWRAFVEAGADGRFELVVPFPSGLVRPTIRSAARWSLRVGDGPAVLVDVPEAAVRVGDVLRVGELRTSAPAPSPRSRDKLSTAAQEG